jgi:hypothetical protein
LGPLASISGCDLSGLAGRFRLRRVILRLRLLSMDQKMPLKLPRYVFRRANGSYRYKRNVPKALRQVIPKATVYRQLGESYDEAIRRLPVVHAEIEALFDQERNTPSSVRASLCPAYHPRRQRRPPCRNRRARGKRHRPRGWLPAHPPQHTPPPEDQNVRTHDPTLPQSHSVPQAPASSGHRHRPHLPTICPTKGK